MNILVIKTTSLGDVLHSTPHIRAIREQYPAAHITLLTATGSAQIYRHNPAIDRLVLFDHARFKKLGLSSPRAVLELVRQTLAELNDREYALAFDLQGLLRTVIFLYFVRSGEKYVKGRWPGLGGFRDKQLHAIDEMSQVLAQADIPVSSNHMDFICAPEVLPGLVNRLNQLGLNGLNGLIGPQAAQEYIVISPFTRWTSKNWPLQRFVQAAINLSKTHTILITGTREDREEISAHLGAEQSLDNIYNLAGEFDLAELAELMSKAALVISGDSFPMHLATAVDAPLIALFGPTDEHKTGPRSSGSRVLRPADCDRCDRPNCSRACLGQITVYEVVAAAREKLNDRAEFETA